MSIKRHEVKHADGGTVTVKNMTQSMAIKLFCEECCGFESNPMECLCVQCPLFPFRGRTLKNRSRHVFTSNGMGFSQGKSSNSGSEGDSEGEENA